MCSILFFVVRAVWWRVRTVGLVVLIVVHFEIRHGLIVLVVVLLIFAPAGHGVAHERLLVEGLELLVQVV